MVKGLEVFKEHFKDYSNKYALIGGTACYLVMEDAGLGFRATKDLDIVLCVEAHDADFVEAFWTFIKEGEYTKQEKSSGKRQFYRFSDPKDDRYPAQLELFSQKPDILEIREDTRFTSIPIDGDLSSLSAILLDDDYYNLIQSGTVDIDGFSIVKSEYLIPLKIRAWMDLRHRRESGEAIDSNKIKKHRNDVFRLYRVINPEGKVSLDSSVREDMNQGIELLEKEANIDQISTQFAERNVQDVIHTLKNIYL